jgi:hypothetical protein
VLKAERAGEPVVVVGNRPRRASVPWLIEPLLVVGKPTILFGPEGVGKSYIAAAVAASYRLGHPIIPQWRPAGNGQVLVLDWEDDEDEWNDRLRRLTDGCGEEPVDLVYRYGRGPLADDVEEITRLVAEHHVGLVIVDSISKAAPPGREGGDPSDTANRLFSALRYIGGTSLLIDHVTKVAGTKGADRPYGSVFKPAWARVTFDVTRVDDPGNPDIGHLVLTNRKRNSGPRTARLGLAINYGEDMVRFSHEDSHAGDGPSTSDLILEAVADHAQALYDIVAFVKVRKDVQDDTVRRECARLVTAHVLNRFVGPDGVERLGLAQHEEKAA